MKEFTQTFEYRVAGNLLTRFEFRREYSNQPTFLKGPDRIVDGQNTVILGPVYSFDASD